MEFLKSLSSRKIAGIPVLYLLLVLAVVGLYAAFKMKASADPAGDTPSSDTTDSEATDAATVEATVDGDAAGTIQPAFTANPVVYQASNGQTIVATPQEDTNSLWAKRAVVGLMGKGYTLTTASSAVQGYLDGSTLSVEQGKARDAAVATYGLPPDEDMPVASTAAVKKPTAPSVYKGPASKQGVPRCTHVVKGTSDDTFAELAHLYYGVKNVTGVAQINGANPSVQEPFKVGTPMVIPALATPKYYVSTSATNTLTEIAKKNGLTTDKLTVLNPGMAFPVRVKTRVRIK